MGFKEPGRLEAFLDTWICHYAPDFFFRKYVESIGLKGDESVLDYGSGSGRLSKYVAKALLKGNGRLTCVDISHVWMRFIKGKLRNYPNVEFKLGEIGELDIGDYSFDEIIIHFVSQILRNLQDRRT